jgi:hypothetical protein
MKKDVSLSLSQHEFLSALKLGPDGFVAYFSKWIDEDLLRFQDRETASMLLAEELSKLKMPLRYLKSLINNGYIRYRQGSARDSVIVEFTDIFFDGRSND